VKFGLLGAVKPEVAAKLVQLVTPETTQLVKS
jgi:hypothetical protein